MKNNSQKSSVAPKKSAVCGLPPSPRLRRTCRSAVCNPRGRQAAAFTLLELLIVIALIMVLAGLLIPAFYKIKNAAKAKRAQIEARVIGSAIRAYKLQEHKFPAPTSDLGGGADQTYGVGGRDNSEVMAKLRSAAPPVLDVDKLRWDDDDNVLNPDDDQYKITLDLNYDGKVGGDPVEFKVE